MIIANQESSLFSSWPNVTIDNSVVRRVKTAKNLGVWFDERLCWMEHVAVLCGKVFGSLRRLWKVAWAMPQLTRARLVRSLVFPMISYASPVFSGLTSMLMMKITKAFNACIRFAYGLKKIQGTSSHSHLLLGGSLKSFFETEVCCTMHKLIFNKSPKYLADRIIFSMSSRTLRLNVPRSRRRKLDGQFFIKGVKLWNSIPIHVKRIRNIMLFRTACMHELNSRRLV